MKAIGEYPRSLGCCGASCKERCKNPPCPCNLDAWTPAEVERIRREQRAKARKAQGKTL